MDKAPVSVVAEMSSEEIENEVVKDLRKGIWRGEVYAGLRQKGIPEEVAKQVVDAAEYRVGEERYSKINRAAFVFGALGYLLICCSATVLANAVGHTNFFEVILGGIVFLIKNEIGYKGMIRGAQCGYIIYGISALVYYW